MVEIELLKRALSSQHVRTEVSQVFGVRDENRRAQAPPWAPLITWRRRPACHSRCALHRRLVHMPLLLHHQLLRALWAAPRIAAPCDGDLYECLPRASALAL